jgi:hypothetical protein
MVPYEELISLGCDNREAIPWGGKSHEFVKRGCEV